MTQRELLEILRKDEPRMDIGTLSRIETGFVLPASEEVLEALEKALQAPREDLFEGVEVFAMKDTRPQRKADTAWVASFLEYGKAYAVTRKELAERMGLSDRAMREKLEAARADGLVICCDQDGKGYYLPDTQEEILRQYIQSRNRTMSQLRQQKYLRARMQA